MTMNNIEKPNDIFVATVLNPDANMMQLLQSGVKPDNTGLLSPDAYKNTDFVKKAFTDENGKFNDLAFNNAYLIAAKQYEDLTDADFYKNLEKNIEFNPLSRARRPDSKIMDITPEIVKISNPFEAKKGITSMFGANESDFSIRELAEKSKIWDTKKGEWRDKTPNDLGFLGTALSETLVFAQWDEDGTHFDEELGRDVTHKKGQYKLNDENKFYTETLGDREIYSKQILSPLDVLTKDGSFLNSIDFFDADGKEKSITGTTFKTIATIVPYLIPKFNRVWGGITAGIGLASTMPSLYKSLEGIFTGEDQFENQSSLWKAMNSAEGFMSKFTTKSVSDEASKSMASYEQLSSMVGDIFGQIYQQRAMASLSNLVGPGAKLKNITNTLDPNIKDLIEKQSEISKALSLGYMALSSAGSLYGEAIEAGYDRRTAGFGTLVALGGTYAVMNDTKMGTWFLDKTTGYSTEVNRSILRKALKEPMDDFAKAFQKMSINKVDGKKDLSLALKKSKDSIKRFFTEAADQGEEYWKNSLLEGFEEVTEQVVLDAVKGGMDTLSYLGVTKKEGSFGGFDNVFSKEGLSNYIMSFAGGLVGGALFEFQNKKIEPFLQTGKIPKDVSYSLIRHIANGNTQDLIDEVNKQRGNIGNKYLSPQLTDINGNAVSMASKEGLTESDLIADNTIEYIKYLDGIIKQEGLNISDDDLIKKAFYSDLIATQFEKDKSGIDKLVFRDINKAADKIVSLRAELESLEKDETNKENNKEQIKKIKEKLEEARLLVKDIVDGNKSSEYVAKTLLYFKPEMHEPLISLNREQYAKSIYNVEYKDLPDKGGDISKELIDEKFKEFQDQPELVNKLDEIFDIYKSYQEIFSKSIKDYTESEYADIRKDSKQNILNNYAIGALKTALKDPELIDNANWIKTVSSELHKSGLKNFTLVDVIQGDLFDYLVKNNIIAVNHLTPEEQEKVKMVMDNYANSPIEEYNSDFIGKIVESINTDETLLNKIIYNPGNVQDNFNLQEEALLNFIEQQPKIDKELYNIINNRLIQKKDNKVKYFAKMANSLESTINEMVDNYIKDESEMFNSFGIPVSEEVQSKFNELEVIKNTLNINNLLNDIQNSTEDEAIYKEFQNNLNKLSEIILGSDIKNLDLETILERDYSTETRDFISKEFSEINNIIDIKDKVKETFENVVKNKELVVNPIFDLLRQIELISVGNVKKSIINLLEQESNLLSQSNIENYIKEGYTYQEIKQGIDVLKMAKSIVLGMSSKQDESNAFGFNQSIINYLKKHKEEKGIENYNTISDIQGILVNSEFDSLIDKLEFLLNLSDSNVESKDKEHITIRNNYTKLFLNHYENNSYTYKGTTLISNKAEILNRTDITDEHKIVLIEKEIFDNFTKLGLKTEEELSEFIDDFFEEIINEQNASSIVSPIDPGLTGNMNYIPVKYLFNHLLTVLSTDSLDINARIREVLKDDGFLYSPFFGQEYDARIAYALHLNKPLFENAYKKVNSKTSGSYTQTTNIVSLLGISGAGKTSVTGQYVLRFLLQDDAKAEIAVSGPNSNRINALNKAITKTLQGDDLNNNIHNLDKKTLFDTFVYFDANGEQVPITQKFEDLDKLLKTNKDPNSWVVDGLINYDGKRISLNNSDTRKFKFKKDLGIKTPSAIFIDEITHFSKMELELLDLIAKEFNFTVFAFGDPSQKGYTIQGQKYSISEILPVNTPYLRATVRSGNIHQKDNNLTLNVISEKLEELERKPDFKPLQEKFLNESKRFLKYYESDTELHGSKIVASFTESDAKMLYKVHIANIAKEGKNNSKLGIITIDGNGAEQEIEILKKVGFTDEMLKVYALENVGENPVQGDEGDYFIIKMPESSHWEKDTTLTNYITSLYTATSRSLEGSLVIEPDLTNQKYNVYNKQELNTVVRPFPKERILKNKTDRILELDAIVGNYSYSKKDTQKTAQTVVNTIKKPTITNPSQEVSKETIKNNDSNIPTLDNNDLKKEGFGHSIMMHSFYNRLGVNNFENNKDEYVITSPNNNSISEDLQIIKGIVGTKINKKHIDSFIKLKNIVSLHYDNLSELEKSITSNPQLMDFLEKVAGVKYQSFIKAIKNKSFSIKASKYDNAIDEPAFKFENDSKKRLSNDDIFLRFALNITLPNKKQWVISLAAFPSIQTMQSDKVKFYLGEDAVNDYVKFENKISEKLKNQEFLDIPINNPKRLFISYGRTVDAIRDVNIPDGKNKISLDNLENELPGVFINYNELSGKKTVGIFSSSNIQSEYNKGHKKEVKLTDQYLEQAKGQAFIVLSFDNNKQRVLGEENDFRRVYPITPKTRTGTEMFEEYIEMWKNTSSSDDLSRNQQVLISQWNGLKMFYKLKEKLTTVGDVNNWDIYLNGNNKSLKHSFAYLANIDLKQDSSEKNKLIDMIDYLNTFSKFEDLIADINNNKNLGKLDKDPFTMSNFNAGIAILANYRVNYQSNTPNSQSLLTKDILANDSFYYSPFVSKYESQESVSEMDAEFLKYFTLDVVPEPPRFVMNLEEVIKSYITDDTVEKLEIIEEVETPIEIQPELIVETSIQPEVKPLINYRKKARVYLTTVLGESSNSEILNFSNDLNTALVSEEDNEFKNLFNNYHEFYSKFASKAKPKDDVTFETSVKSSTGELLDFEQDFIIPLIQLSNLDMSDSMELTNLLKEKHNLCE